MSRAARRTTGTKSSVREVAEHGPQPGLGLATSLYFVLALVYFVTSFLPGRQIYGSDYLAGGYFFQQFVSARFAAGHLPAWVPYLYGGLPLFANPGNAFYPLRFLIDWILPVSRLLPALFVLQFWLAGTGMYVLARELEVRRWIALVVGLAFEFTGLAMSFVLAGQDGRIIAATLTPLTFFFLHRAIRTGRLRWFAGLAATVGFVLLGFQIQMAYYLLLAGGIWAIFCLIHLGYHRRPGPLGARVGLGIAAIAFAFAMAAVNFLPFLRYAPQSTRGASPAGRGYAYTTSYSMPPEEILGLAVPEQAGILQNYHGRSPFKLHTEYAGALVVALLFLGALYTRRNRYWWFFAGLVVFELSMAFGGYTPIFRLYYALLPGAKQFRAPNLTFFLVSFSLAVMAALTLERLAVMREERGSPSSARGRRGTAAANPLSTGWWTLIVLLALTVLGAVLAMAGGNSAAHVTRALGYVRFGIFFALIAGTLWAWMTHRLSPRLAVAALAVLTVADLWVIDRHFYRTVNSPDTLFRADGVVDFLKAQPGPFRVWALPFPPGQTYGWAGTDYLMGQELDQAAGEHSDPIQTYAQYLGTGPTGSVDFHNLTRTTVFLDAANIRYLVTGLQLKSPALREVHKGPSGIVYENLTALPRAYLVPQVEIATPPTGALDSMKLAGFDPRQVVVLYHRPPHPLPGGELQGFAHVDTYDPDRVVVSTSSDREAMLVLSDNYYPDWAVRVDGKPAELLRADHTFRAVEVPAGQHQVTFSFRPGSLITGFRIYLVCVLLLAGYGLALGALTWRRRRADSGAVE